MKRAFFIAIGYLFFGALILGGLTQLADGAPAKLHAISIESGDHPILQIAPPTIHRKCPCWMYQADGFIELAPGGTDSVGPDSTDYAGGHWSSEGAVSFFNRPPKTPK